MIFSAPWSSVTGWKLRDCEWTCALCNAARDTGVVATCGGDTVCLIDCGTGQVMKRFKQQKEVWTAVQRAVVIVYLGSVVLSDNYVWWLIETIISSVGFVGLFCWLDWRYWGQFKVSFLVSIVIRMIGMMWFNPLTVAVDWQLWVYRL